MKLIFLFTQQKPAKSPNEVMFNPKIPAKNHFAVNTGGLKSEGYLYLLQRMKASKIADDVLIFIESNRGPGFCKLGKIPCYVVPHIEHIDPYIEKGDIIWVRGGFKTWYDWLVEKSKNHWLLLYAANTGRQRWKFWHIIFDDINCENKIDARGRVFLDFHKPIHPDIFYPMEWLSKEYDVCIGASHIHDKKGQWKVIDGLIKYKKIFGRNLRCVMPGRLMRGVETNHIIKKIEHHDLNVKVTGMIERPEVAKYMNMSRLFVYLGTVGQNDRGPLEALQCGTQVMVANMRVHHKIVYENPLHSWVCTDPLDSKTVAYEIDALLTEHVFRASVHEYFNKVNGISNIILPEMARLFNLFKYHPEPNTKVLINEYQLNHST
jgi:glycosyltransferase involved in cell wall biosynthesis